MALSIDRQQLDAFCERLFRTLDGLGLLPLQLWAKPTEFEKYPRLLFGSIRRYNDVVAGFKEWESRVLRDAAYRKEAQYPELEKLRQWMSEHADLLTNKANLQHLRSSLYARVFEFLYPRRVLVNAYCVKHKGEEKALEPEFVDRELPGSVEADVAKLRGLYSDDDWGTIVADAKASLLANAQYYRKVLRGEEQPLPSEAEEAELLETEEPAEE